MLTPSLTDSLYSSGFAHRATPRPDGTVTYLLADGSGYVRVDGARWQALVETFGERLRPVQRRTRWVSIGLPPAILAFGMILGGVVPFAGLAILAVIIGAGPLIFLRHSAKVRSIAAEMETVLAACPPCSPPPVDPRREPRWFEIVFIVLVGPHLLLAIAGEIGGPDLFRGTPYWGAAMGSWDVIALLLVAARLAWPKFAPAIQRHAKQWRTGHVRGSASD